MERATSPIGSIWTLFLKQDEGWWGVVAPGAPGKRGSGVPAWPGARGATTPYPSSYAQHLDVKNSVQRHPSWI